jgi:two-component system nitrogen regulation sensor histidine kinase GlnL
MHYSAYSGLELLDSAVLVLDHAWRIVYLNPAAESLFELSQRLAAGLSLEQAFPNDGKALLQAATLARRNNTSFIEHDLKLLTASHNELHLSCNATPLESGNAALLIEFRPIDQQIKIANEERILVQQQANRELIRNLAHEIKNPLGGIRGAAQLLERELVRRELTEYTQVIIQEAERLQSLLDRLLTPHPHSTSGGGEYSRSAGAGAQRGCWPSTPTGLKIRRDYDTSLPPLTGDKEQLIQVMLNIARNAVQAMQGQGEIILRTRVTRQVTLARKRHRLAMLHADHRQRAGHSRCHLRQYFLSAGVGPRRWHRAGADIWRKPISINITVPSNSTASQATPASISCCPWQTRKA